MGEGSLEQPRAWHRHDPIALPKSRPDLCRLGFDHIRFDIR